MRPGVPVRPPFRLPAPDRRQKADRRGPAQRMGEGQRNGKRENPCTASFSCPPRDGRFTCRRETARVSTGGDTESRRGSFRNSATAMTVRWPDKRGRLPGVSCRATHLPFLARCTAPHCSSRKRGVRGVDAHFRGAHPHGGPTAHGGWTRQGSPRQRAARRAARASGPGRPTGTEARTARKHGRHRPHRAPGHRPQTTGHRSRHRPLGGAGRPGPRRCRRRAPAVPNVENAHPPQRALSRNSRTGASVGQRAARRVRRPCSSRATVAMGRALASVSTGLAMAIAASGWPSHA